MIELESPEEWEEKHRLRNQNTWLDEDCPDWDDKEKHEELKHE